MKTEANRKTKGSPLLEIKGLQIAGFRDDHVTEIVKGIDLSLARGEVLGLIGESGAGKSSVGLAAMGYAKGGCRITGGQVLFEGEDLCVASSSRKRQLRGTRIAYVAQSAAAAFNPAHRLNKQIAEAPLRAGLMSRQQVRAETVSLYKQLSLPNPEVFGFRYPHQVSGGQLQRAMTAMAMICTPDLIIFDEPTTALDVTTQVEVLATIRALVERHHTAALYITHDLAVAAQMADRIMVLRHGAVVEEAPTREMMANPKTEYTRTLWAVRELEKPSGSPAEPLLNIQQLDAWYSDFKVLNSINVTVPRGRTVCLVGESGSGKSTLGRAVVGLMSQVKGNITYNGAPLPPNIRDRSPELLRKIQMIHQIPDTAMNPRHTVREIIGRPLRLFQKLKGATLDAEIKRLLERIELDEDFIDRYPHELSGGQKQRICIARALAAKPELIVCDEVTSALDQVVQEGILRLLMGIQQESGISYIFITHDIATVRAIADDVVVMNKGEIVEQGHKDQVLSPPHKPYTELLLSSVPNMDADWLTELLKTRSSGASVSVLADESARLKKAQGK
jgi:peptide/nickel transport system ATP-binding protein